jgi:NDP-4-keto-2,6-dideoxyhexose 3-C-methyltransferase
MDAYREVVSCRVCGATLEEVLDLGDQCLGGQFPAADAPDPPRAPLVLGRCAGECGLVQLLHTVRPELMFSDYWYRSAVNPMMRDHLDNLAAEARELLGREPGSVLDIGCNDGTLLSRFPDCKVRYGVDPCGVAVEALRQTGEVVADFYPTKAVEGCKFDLVFSVACFYDSNEPVEFARAVRDNLAQNGLWCLEVADWPYLLAAGCWDTVCHEHLAYWDLHSLDAAFAAAGLEVFRAGHNDCNGGSLRLYLRRRGDFAEAPGGKPPGYNWGALRAGVAVWKKEMTEYLGALRLCGVRTHLLGASTKANTWLQLLGPGARMAIEAASDRDPRKAGRVTPGTRIPIITEDASRQLHPDVLLVGPWHFRKEILVREAEFLDRGGRLAFPLPRLEEVKR